MMTAAKYLVSENEHTVWRSAVRARAHARQASCSGGVAHKHASLVGSGSFDKTQNGIGTYR